MAYDTILLDVAKGAARLTLNRPDRLNSFNVEMHREVAEALSRVERDPEIRALLITGAGRGFCAGQDLSDRAVTPGDDASTWGSRSKIATIRLSGSSSGCRNLWSAR